MSFLTYYYNIKMNLKNKNNSMILNFKKLKLTFKKSNNI